jgi:hypothetical protein
MKALMQTAPVSARDSGGPEIDEQGQGIFTGTVYVVFTSIEETLLAAGVAAGFANPLGLPVTVVHFQIVPYPLPVDGTAGCSPIESDEFRTRVASLDLHVQLRTYRCRRERDAMPRAFYAPSLIVLSNRRRWWTTRSSHWRKTLEAAGHYVVSVNAPEHKEPFHA